MLQVAKAWKPLQHYGLGSPVRDSSPQAQLQSGAADTAHLATNNSHIPRELHAEPGKYSHGFSFVTPALLPAASPPTYDESPGPGLESAAPDGAYAPADQMPSPADELPLPLDDGALPADDSSFAPDDDNDDTGEDMAADESPPPVTTLPLPPVEESSPTSAAEPAQADDEPLGTSEVEVSCLPMMMPML